MAEVPLVGTSLPGEIPTSLRRCRRSGVKRPENGRFSGLTGLAPGLQRDKSGGATMTAHDRVYFHFAREHYVGRPLRDPEHVEALLEAAAVPPGKVDAGFWRQVRTDWVWGVSSAPFDAATANAAYRRHCVRRGVKP
jgi:hypothetical protein